MRFDLLIPTGGNLERIGQLLHGVAVQTVVPEHIVVVLDKPREQEEIEHFLYSLHKILWDKAGRLLLVHHRMSDFEPEQWIGYVRKYLLSQAISSFVYMIDDDNLFEEDFFECTLRVYQQIVGEVGKECILSPTILRRKTGKIQSQWIEGFASYLFPKYRFAHLGERPWGIVQMIGGNSLFGARTAFQKYRFDERFWWSYEDVDYTWGLTQQGVPIVVSGELGICHMEKERSPLGTMQMETPLTAYARARNRVGFVKKHATRGQRLQYVCCGLRVQTVSFFIAAKRRWGAQRWVFWRMIWKGTLDGLAWKYPSKSMLEEAMQQQ